MREGDREGRGRELIPKLASDRRRDGGAGEAGERQRGWASENRLAGLRTRRKRPAQHHGRNPPAPCNNGRQGLQPVYSRELLRIMLTSGVSPIAKIQNLSSFGRLLGGWTSDDGRILDVTVTFALRPHHGQHVRK